MPPKDNDIASMTQLIELMQDRGCAVDRATAKEHAAALAEIPHISQSLNGIVERLDRIEGKMDSQMSDVKQRVIALEIALKVGLWLLGAAGAFITGALALGACFWGVIVKALLAAAGVNLH